MDFGNTLNYCVNVIGESGMPSTLGNMIHYVYLAIKIVIPILLVIFGAIDLGKAITAGKEDEIKKAQSGFIKELIVGVLVFLVLTIVEFVVGFAGGNKKDNSKQGCDTMTCVKSILEGNESKCGN